MTFDEFLAEVRRPRAARLNNIVDEITKLEGMLAPKKAERDRLLAELAEIDALRPPVVQRVTPVSGIFTGGGFSNSPETPALRVQHFDEWLYGSSGKTTPIFIDFFAENSWSGLAGSLGIVHVWKLIPGKLAVGMPLVTVPNGAAGFAEVIAGTRDPEFTQAFNALIGNGLADSIIRLAIECTGNWKAWNAATDSVGFIRAFRHVVTLARRLPGANFTFVWNVSIGRNAIPWQDCYPGSLFVDQIGFDIYDMWLGQIPPTTQAQRWEKALNGAFGLRDIANFAEQAEKPLCIPEWGTGRVETNSEGGGIENPFFIERMHDFITDKRNNVLWHAYWNRDAGSGYEGQIFPTNLRPQTAQKYKDLFGAV